MGKQKTFQILFKSAPPKTFTSSHGYLLTTSLLLPSPTPQKKKKNCEENFFFQPRRPIEPMIDRTNDIHLLLRFV